MRLKSLAGIKLALVMLVPMQSQAGLPIGQPPPCQPNMSCIPTTPPVTPPGTCGPAAGGPTCSAGGPAVPNGSPGPNIGAGNPINVITGNKYQREVDMAPLPGALGLEIVRHYNSAYSKPGHSTNLLGRGWKLSYETELYPSATALQIIRADGSRSMFNRDPRNPSLCAGATPADGTVTVSRTARGEEYLWRWPDGRQLSFNSAGKLVQILAPTGEFVTLQHDRRGLLTRVTDPQGRHLQIDYPGRQETKGFRGISSITTPLGRFDYTYGSTVAKSGSGARMATANLAKVSMPGGQRYYHYEDPRFPTLLTGISAWASGAPNEGRWQRLATYGYDANGRGNLTVRGLPARPSRVPDGRVAEPAVQEAGTGREQVTLNYSTPGLTVITNSLGQRTRYLHAVIAGEYRLKEVRGAGCASCGETNVRYVYDASGRLSETVRIDDAGQPLSGVRTELDRMGRIVREYTVSYVDGKPGQPVQVKRYAYGSDANPAPTLVARPSVVTGREAVIKLDYNKAGQLVSMTESGWVPAAGADAAPAPLHRTTLYGYRLINGRSLLVLVDGPLRNGRLASPADSDITLIDYDRRGNAIASMREPGDALTEVRQRDAALRPTEVLMQDGKRRARVTTSYAAHGVPNRIEEKAWVLDAKGEEIADSARTTVLGFQYDSLARLRTSENAGQVVLRHLYDDGGNRTHDIGSDGSQTARSFDLESRLLAEATYNASGTLTSLRAGELAAQARKDAPGMRLRAGAPGTSTEQLIEQVLRADGSVVRRWIDDFGRMVALETPEQGLRRAEYSAAGDLTGLIGSGGERTRIVRDVRGRALTVEHLDRSGKPMQRVDYHYDGAVLVSEALLAGDRLVNKVSWDTDANGRVVGKKLEIAPAQTGKPGVAMALGFHVDEAARAVVKTLPSGAKVRYVYDSGAHLTGLFIDGTAVVSQLRYASVNGARRVVGFAYGNGRRSIAQFDAGGSPTLFNSGTQEQRFSYLPDQRTEVNIRQVLAPEAPNRVASWLSLFSSLMPSAQAADNPAATRLQGPGLFLSYRYDEHARLVEEHIGQRSVVDVRYDALGNRVNGAQAERDPNGNVIRRQGQELLYDAAGKLVEVRAGGRTVARYVYDAQGMRVAKYTPGSSRYYLYDEGQLVAEADRDGAVTAEYIYVGRRPVARLRHVSEGGLFGSTSRIEYLHADARDAVEAVSDDRGAVVWEAQLDSFGQVRDSRHDPRYMPLRLSGQYADSETGLHYNVHRYYDPASGRYLQPDPLGITGGLNLYAYVDNDPIRRTDPLGLMPEEEPWEPWRFGTHVHNWMAAHMRTRGLGWGANDGRSGTWIKARPDVYFVDTLNLGKELLNPKSFKGTLWELKPISWSSAVNPAKYKIGLGEVGFYTSPITVQRGCWSAGSTAKLMTELVPLQGRFLVWNMKTYEMTFLPDIQTPDSGLFFYHAKELANEPAPKTVPAPVLEKAKSDLQDSMEGIKDAAAAEGWETVKTIGMIVLIGIAIYALIALAVAVAPVVLGLIASIGAMLAAVSAGQIALTAALIAVFGLAPSADAQAKQKGKEKQSGILDSTIDWFKSWF